MCDDTFPSLPPNWCSIGQALALTSWLREGGGCCSGFQPVAMGLVSLMHLWKPETARAKSPYRAAEKKEKKKDRRQIENRNCTFRGPEQKVNRADP